MANLQEKLTVSREKNFVKENIQRAKHLYPTEPKWRFVDTRYGDSHDLKKSGLHPIYVHKKDYGKVPRFVKISTKADAKVETDEQPKDDKIPACRYVDEEERKTLLKSMKQKWEEIMKRFRGLPFLADTLPKAQRKARLEKELQQLEKDIAIIEQHQHIYIYDDDADV